MRVLDFKLQTVKLKEWRLMTKNDIFHAVCFYGH